MRCYSKHTLEGEFMFNQKYVNISIAEYKQGYKTNQWDLLYK